MESWLHVLELSEYEELFYREGYKKAEDIINLKELDRAQLVAMGITKRGQFSTSSVETNSSSMVAGVVASLL